MLWFMTVYSAGFVLVTSSVE